MSSVEVILTQIEPDIDGFRHHNERFVPCGKAHVRASPASHPKNLHVEARQLYKGSGASAARGILTSSSQS